MEKNLFTVLITGIGSPGAAGVVRSLRLVRDFAFRIIGADIDPEAVGAAWTDAFYLLPRPDENSFQDVLLGICKKEHVNIILPLVTMELEPIAKMQSELKSVGTVLSLSSQEALQKANNKGLLLDALCASGIPVPEFRVVRSGEELQRAIDEISVRHEAVCFKPVFGDGSRGFRIVDNRPDRHRYLLREKPGSAYISRADLEQIGVCGEELPELIVTEYLPGLEYSVDVLADHGKTVVAVPRCRHQMTGGITTRGVITNEPDVLGYVGDVIQAIELHGNVGVQVRRNARGEPRIIEVNPRLQGTSIHSTAAGVNLPWLGIKLALGHPIVKEELAVRFGTRMVRYWEEVFFDATGKPFHL